MRWRRVESWVVGIIVGVDPRCCKIQSNLALDLTADAAGWVVRFELIHGYCAGQRAHYYLFTHTPKKYLGSLQLWHHVAEEDAKQVKKRHCNRL